MAVQIVLLLCAQFAGIFAPSSHPGLKCNGHQKLCDLRIDQVTFPGTHNSGSGFDGMLYYKSTDTFAPSCLYRNQDLSFEGQAEYGIRFFDIDTCWLEKTDHPEYEEVGVWTCHERAWAGSITTVLAQIDRFMKNHPHEVIFIHFGRDTNDQRTKEIYFDLTGKIDAKWKPSHDRTSKKLLSYNDEFDINGEWPTMREAIESNKRIFLLLNNKFLQHSLTQRNGFMTDDLLGDTWDVHPILIGMSCSGVVVSAKEKCSKYMSKELMAVSSFGSYGACVKTMMQICNDKIFLAGFNCDHSRKQMSKAVTTILVDYPNHDSLANLINTCQILNAYNIDKFADVME